MSKAFLILDMPSSCSKCDFVQIDNMVGNMTCMNPISEVYGCDVSDYIGCRADGCPICGREFYEKFNYCPGCGTELKWGDCDEHRSDV